MAGIQNWSSHPGLRIAIVRQLFKQQKGELAR
jgi:hypothetical protein